MPHRGSRFAARVFFAFIAFFAFAACSNFGTPVASSEDAGPPDAPAPPDAAEPPPDALIGSPPNEQISALSTSLGTLSPAFSATTTSYTVQVVDSFSLVPFTVKATAADKLAKITVNNKPADSGADSSPIELSLTAPTAIDVAVTAPGGVPAHTTIVVTAWSEYTYVKASNTRSSAQFGFRVALSGDTLAVGSPAESSNATGIGGNQSDISAPSAGAVYVFTRTAGVWSQQAYIKASNAQANTEFGESVALSGDTLAVGALGESSSAVGVGGNQADTSAPSSGAVYVFTRTTGTWTQQAYIKASNTRTAAGFGSSVALSGDTLAVGAPGESSNATVVGGDQNDTSALKAGAVYVFTRTSGAWTQQAYVKASNTRAGANFGAPLALSGDTLAISAVTESSNSKGIDGVQSDATAPAAGAVYVFARTAGVWSQQAYVKASNTRAGANFGCSVALSGNTLAVGSIEESSNATGIGGNQADTSLPEAGAVYVFARVAGAWSQQAYVKASNTKGYMDFGYSVALSGDTLAVGSWLEPSNATGIGGNQADTSVTQSGAVYVFTRAAGFWSQTAYVKASNNRSDAAFGYSVALTGDTLAVGAVQESSGATGVGGNPNDSSAGSSGAVYVIR